MPLNLRHEKEKRIPGKDWPKRDNISRTSFDMDESYNGDISGIEMVGSPSRSNTSSSHQLLLGRDDSSDESEELEHTLEEGKLDTLSPLTPLNVTSSIEKESLQESPLDMDEQEMMPLTLADENDSYSPRNIWRACRRPRSGSKKGDDKQSDSESLGDDSSKNKELSKTQQAQQKFKGFLKLFESLSRETNEYAPSGPIVASAGLDLCMPVLLNFHMFMILTHTDGAADMQIPPQVLPLIFLSILMIRSFIPFKSRKRFWKTVHSAVSAPFYTVIFRDEIIGEVATSAVRPFQDIFFALFYYFASMYDICTGSPELEHTGTRLETNIVLHNIVLPTCAVLPLVSRYLQTLRQAYDEQRRWPHLGNSFKYATAIIVIFYGMTHSEEERSKYWKYCALACLLYQIWWDIVIDWEVLRIIPREEVSSCSCTRIPFISRIKLRSQTLFKNERTYWRIIIFNTLFRFTWMLCFIPAYHLDWDGKIKNTLTVELSTVVSFTVGLLELLRRCFWVLLRLELETIKLTSEKYNGNTYAAPSSKVKYRCCAPKENSETPSQRNAMKWAQYRILVKRLFCLELFVYFAGTAALGIVVATLI